MSRHQPRPHLAPANSHSQVPYHDSDQQVPVQRDPRHPQPPVEAEDDDRRDARGDGDGQHGHVVPVAQQQARRDAAGAVVGLDLPGAGGVALLCAVVWG